MDEIDYRLFERIAESLERIAYSLMEPTPPTTSVQNPKMYCALCGQPCYTVALANNSTNATNFKVASSCCKADIISIQEPK